MKKTTLNKIKANLEKMRAELIVTIKDRAAEGLSIETEVQDEMDIAAESSTKHLMLQLADKDKNKLRQIDTALQRINDGTYGVCIDTEEDIEEARLLANPFALRTIEAQEAFEKKAKMQAQMAKNRGSSSDSDDE